MPNALAAIVAAALMAGTAAAQSPPAAKPSAAPARAAKPPVVRTAKSLDCSKQADAKGLHGKARKGFMSGCKKG